MGDTYGKPKAFDWANWRSTSHGKTQHVVQIKPAEHVKGERPPYCVKCGTEDIIPGLCYTGKVLESYSTLVREKAVLNKVRLEYEIKQSRIPISRYVHGQICNECAGEWRYFRHEVGGEVREYPIVVVDPLPVAQPREQRIGGKSYKGFNTRQVHGKRVAR